VLQVSDAAFGYDPARPLFRGVNFAVDLDSRIALVGPNGAGKSTLVKLILGELAAQEGHISRNAKLRTACFTQHHVAQLDLTLSPLDYLSRLDPGTKAEVVRAHLSSFGLAADLATQRIGTLSGGQKSRVAFALCSWMKPHVLILDEPTNHLDMQSQGVLQRALIGYPGTVLIVSHNRDFLDPLVHKTIEFRPGRKPTLYPGNITYYLEKSAADKAREAAAAKANPVPAPRPTAAPTLSQSPTSSAPSANRKDQRKADADIRNQRNKHLKPLQEEQSSLETKIAEMEAAQATLTTHLSSEEVAADPQKFRETTNAIEKITHNLELAYSRWTELSDQIQIIEEKYPLS
jgi:ATP-binding cassette subfamily F protein 3